MASYAAEIRTATARFVELGEEIVEVDTRFAAGASGDTDPPIVSNVTPATGGALAALDEWGCDVTDADSGVAGVTIFRGGEGARRIEVIYETSLGACRGYTVTVTTITDGYRYRVRAEDGWPRVATIYVKATDASGNEATVET